LYYVSNTIIGKLNLIDGSSKNIFIEERGFGSYGNIMLSGDCFYYIAGNKTLSKINLLTGSSKDIFEEKRMMVDVGFEVNKCDESWLYFFSGNTDALIFSRYIHYRLNLSNDRIEKI
jgi:hypothetical protein